MTDDKTPCKNCGHARHFHYAWGADDVEMIQKHGKEVCYGQGDGGYPGPDAGREACKCREFIQP